MRTRRIIPALAFSLATSAACEREPPTAAAPPAVEAPDSGGHRLAAIEGVFDSIVHPARARIALTISTTDDLQSSWTSGAWRKRGSTAARWCWRLRRKP